jgi:DNA-binding transcriptional LysR family regulator
MTQTCVFTCCFLYLVGQVRGRSTDSTCSLSMRIDDWYEKFRSQRPRLAPSAHLSDSSSGDKRHPCCGSFGPHTVHCQPCFEKIASDFWRSSLRAFWQRDCAHRARGLRDPVTAILDSIKQLSDARPFDPRDAPLEFVIAANDATRDLLFPRLMLDAAQEQIDLRLSFIPSGLPSTKLLNDARCDLIVTPMPPDGPDIIQSKLFEGEMHCYYDATQRDPPRNWDAYRTDRHIAVRFADGRASSELVAHVDSAPIKPPVLTVTNFGSLVPFIKGSTLLATALNHTGLGPLKELDHAPLPFSTDPVSVFLVWHRRDSTDPAHRWLHDRIRQSARALKLQN